jgi:hypothetical protein
MDEGWPRPRADNEYSRRDEAPIMRRPDRIALWAVAIAVVGMLAAAASAHGATGATPPRSRSRRYPSRRGGEGSSSGSRDGFPAGREPLR